MLQNPRSRIEVISVEAFPAEGVALLYILIACCNVTVSRVCLLASVASDGFSGKHC